MEIDLYAVEAEPLIALRRVLIVLTTLVLSACGGSGGGVRTVPSTGASTSAPASTSVVAPFSILIPNAASTAAHSRSAQYISSNTASVAVFAYVSSATPPPTATTVVNVGAGQANCSAVATGTSCTITVPATLGPMTFLMKMYDGPNATGNLLSSGTVAVTIVANQPSIPLTLNATVASVQLALASPSVAAGGGTTTLIVNARDPSGATIVGAGSYSVPITITASDPSVTVSPSIVTSPSQTVTVTYTAASPSNVTLSASAQGLSANSLASVLLSIAQSPAAAGLGTVYVAATNYNNYTSALVTFSSAASGDVVPSFTFGLPAGAGVTPVLATDSAGDIAVVGATQESIAIYPPGSKTTTRSLSFPSYIANGLVAMDPPGNIYYANTYPPSINVYTAGASGSATPARTITISGSIEPMAIGVDSAGEIFVLEGNYGPPYTLAVFAAGASGAATPARSLNVSSITCQYPNMAVAPDGRVALTCAEATNYLIGDVYMFAPGATTLSPSITASPYFAGGAYIAFGPNDALYTSGSYSVSYPAIGVFSATATGSAVPMASIITSFGPTVGGFAQIAVGGPVTTSPAATSVSGDMISLAASKTWNYTAHGNGITPYTVTTYSDPQPSNGNSALLAYATTSVTADALPAEGGVLVGAVGLAAASDGPHAETFGSLSNNSFGAVPGTPLLVPTTLSLGQTFIPITGVTGTVTAIGTNVPGIAACPSGSTGATVSYVSAYGSNSSLINEAVTYVPGCGITNLLTDDGVAFTLQSTGSHPELGEQSIARRVLDANYLDTFRSLWQATFRRWAP